MWACFFLNEKVRCQQKQLGQVGKSSWQRIFKEFLLRNFLLSQNQMALPLSCEKLKFIYSEKATNFKKNYLLWI